MAVLFKKKIGGVLYEVRSAGASIRLYTDGVFHSHWNPNSPLAGHIWDLLFLPTLFHADPMNLKKVLVLGVGGGTVINQLNHYLKPAKIFGVDMDSNHLSIAGKFFGVDQTSASLCCEEASQWLMQNPDEQFDVMIEDLFIHQTESNDAVRAIPSSVAWLQQLHSHLADQGLLIMNFESLKDLKAGIQYKAKLAGFRSAYAFCHDRYENAIGVLSSSQLEVAHFNQQQVAFPLINRARKSCRLHYTMQKIRLF